MNIEDRFKDTEEELKKYKENKSMFEAWKLRLELFKNNIDGGIRGIDYSAIKISPTNRATSSVENEIIDRSDEFDRINAKVKEYDIKIRTIDIALKILTVREKTIIERYYFDRAKNIDIAVELDLTEEYICSLKKDIIERLSKIIFLT